MRYYPTIVLCLVVWVTIIVARTDSTNEMDFERAFAIGTAAICWLTFGVCVQKIRHSED